MHADIVSLQLLVMTITKVRLASVYYHCIVYHFVQLHVHAYVYVYIVPNMLTELLYPLQYDGDTPLHLAAKGNKCNTTCVEHLLSTPGIDVNMNNKVSYIIIRYTLL